jgi:hypothetical protein
LGKEQATESPEAALAQSSLSERAYLTHAELDGIVFGVPFQSPDGQEKKAETHFEVERFKAAVFLPKKVFQPGESLPACFVLRSDDDTLYLPAFALFRGDAGADMHIHLRKSGKIYPLFGDRILEDRHGLLAERAAEREKRNGYYVACANLNRLRNSDLEPGDYELYWTYGGLFSSSVKFTIADRRPDDIKRDRERLGSGGHRSGTILVAEITKGGKDDKPKDEAKAEAKESKPDLSLPFSPQEVGKPEYPVQLWEETKLSSFVKADEVVARLGQGIGDKFYPDPRRLPGEDDLLKLSVEWKRKDGRDHLQLTLVPRDRDRKVMLPYQPHFLLLAEYDDLPLKDANSGDAKGEGKSGFPEGRLAPQTWEIRLPEDWQKSVPVAAKVRLSVLVYSDSLKRREKAELADNEWRGVLCSSWAQFERKGK